MRIIGLGEDRSLVLIGVEKIQDLSKMQESETTQGPCSAEDRMVHSHIHVTVRFLMDIPGMVGDIISVAKYHVLTVMNSNLSMR